VLGVTKVAFYHLQRSPLDAVLPKLLEKTLAAGHRAVVIAASVERVEALNMLLWTYHQGSWLPHGSARDESPAEQPVWLTADDENPNGARFLILTDGATSARLGEYERSFELFDGNDPSAVDAARGRWLAYKEAGHGLTYWQQTDGGGWGKKE
jgi:DNA polymerase-3 subunit chi